MPHKPSARRGCVAVCSDANWAWQSLFVLTRSIQLDLGHALDHHLYLTGDVDPRITAIIPPQVVVHEIPQLPPDYIAAAHGRIPPAAMLRLSAFDDLSAVYERVIYLDGDVFQNWGSLEDLLTADLRGCWAAAVRDRLHWAPGFPFGQGRYVERLRRATGVPEMVYLNSGVMLIDSASFRRENVTQKALRFFAENRELCRFGDQSALNAALAGRWAELSPGWNWQMSEATLTLTDGRCPRLIHFTGQPKPWSDALRILPPAALQAMGDFLDRADLSDLLGPRSPRLFDPRTMERKRVGALMRWTRDAPAKRDLIKQYLDRDDFADLHSGVTSYR